MNNKIARIGFTSVFLLASALLVRLQPVAAQGSGSETSIGACGVDLRDKAPTPPQVSMLYKNVYFDRDHNKVTGSADVFLLAANPAQALLKIGNFNASTEVTFDNYDTTTVSFEYDISTAKMHMKISKDTTVLIDEPNAFVSGTFDPLSLSLPPSYLNVDPGSYNDRIRVKFMGYGLTFGFVMTDVSGQ